MKKKSFKHEKIPSGMAGVAGEYAVAMELSRRGYIASITLRNSKGVDILASNSTGSKAVTIQVKTNQHHQKSWVLNEKCEAVISSNFFYVLVNLDTESGYPDFHVVPSSIIANTIKKDHSSWLSSPGKNGRKRNDSSLRKFSNLEGKYLNKWNLLGLD